VGRTGLFKGLFRRKHEPKETQSKKDVKERESAAEPVESTEKSVKKKKVPAIPAKSRKRSSSKKKKTVAIYVIGRNKAPTQKRANEAIALDPDIEIDADAHVRLFGGNLPPRGMFDQDMAIAMMLQNDPKYTEGGYSFKSTWVYDLYLIKITKD
jgi:hypothetical protein